MKKVIVIGCPGSGKSRFAIKLHELTGIKLCHLDLLYWNPDRTVDRERFGRELRPVITSDSWIIDGNYSSTMLMRIAMCDTVFFFDYPTELCLAGLDERRGKPRPDMPWVETESDAEFIEYVRGFRETEREKILKRLDKYPDKTVVTFVNRQNTDIWLECFKQEHPLLTVK